MRKTANSNNVKKEIGIPPMLATDPPNYQSLRLPDLNIPESAGNKNKNKRSRNIDGVHIETQRRTPTSPQVIQKLAKFPYLPRELKQHELGSRDCWQRRIVVRVIDESDNLHTQCSKCGKICNIQARSVKNHVLGCKLMGVHEKMRTYREKQILAEKNAMNPNNNNENINISLNIDGSNINIGSGYIENHTSSNTASVHGTFSGGVGDGDNRDNIINNNRHFQRADLLKNAARRKQDEYKRKWRKRQDYLSTDHRPADLIECDNISLATTMPFSDNQSNSSRVTVPDSFNGDDIDKECHEIWLDHNAKIMTEKGWQYLFEDIWYNMKAFNCLEKEEFRNFYALNTAFILRYKRSILFPSIYQLKHSLPEKEEKCQQKLIDQIVIQSGYFGLIPDCTTKDREGRSVVMLVTGFHGAVFCADIYAYGSGGDAKDLHAQQQGIAAYYKKLGAWYSANTSDNHVVNRKNRERIALEENGKTARLGDYFHPLHNCDKRVDKISIESWIVAMQMLITLRNTCYNKKIIYHSLKERMGISKNSMYGSPTTHNTEELGRSGSLLIWFCCGETENIIIDLMENGSNAIKKGFGTELINYFCYADHRRLIHLILALREPLYTFGRYSLRDGAGPPGELLLVFGKIKRVYEWQLTVQRMKYGKILTKKNLNKKMNDTMCDFRNDVIGSSDDEESHFLDSHDMYYDNNNNKDVNLNWIKIKKSINKNNNNSDKLEVDEFDEEKTVLLSDIEDEEDINLNAVECVLDDIGYWSENRLLYDIKKDKHGGDIYIIQDRFDKTEFYEIKAEDFQTLSNLIINTAYRHFITHSYDSMNSFGFMIDLRGRDHLNYLTPQQLRDGWDYMGFHCGNIEANGMKRVVQQFMNGEGMFGAGEFWTDSIDRNEYYFIDPKQCWYSLLTYDDATITATALFCVRVLSNKCVSVPVEKFMKNYRSTSSHHRQRLGPKTKDKISKLRHNHNQLKKWYNIQ